ncbi:hypothetical protein AB1K70_03900 [Bremerella sp. JC770]|uniref:amidohydrolase family protein n=1 Tax=Bremerella sp. JC770 TaxID=3232137 RepID=UPI00345874EC
MPTPAHPIIDTHQHLWELERMKPPWLTGAGPPLETKNFIEEYTAAVAGLPIDMAVYMEVNVASEQKQLEAERVIRLIDSGNTLTKAAILSANPAAPGFRPFVDQFASTDCVKGYRQVLHSKATPPGYCLSPTFVENCRHLGKQGKTFDLCLRTGELQDGAQLAAACSETRFIVNH